MVNALHFKPSMQRVPVCGIVRVDDGPFGDPRFDEREGLTFRPEHGWHAVAVALADDDDGATLAGTFPATFLIAALVAIGVEAVKFEDI